MKRNVALAILGVAVVTATSVFGQGAIRFNNYQAPYVPITAGGANIGAGEGVQIEVWWGPGTVSESALQFGENADLSGFAGYTDLTQSFTVPAYVGGETWTFQLRASGILGGQAVDSAASRGPLVSTADIGDLGASPPGTPSLVYTPGFEVIVPEPTTFALAGLGAAALLIFRRRD